MELSPRRVAVVLCALTLILGIGAWTHATLTYESEPLTSNVLQLEDAFEVVGNGTDDVLVNLSFSSGDDQLEWTRTSISLIVDDIRYDCSTSGLTSAGSSLAEDDTAKIASKLNADGHTFTVQVDATDEDTFTNLSLDSMNETVGTFSLKFSKTDIIIGDSVRAMVVTGQEFDELDRLPNNEYSLNSGDRIEWYDYDISVHRVVPKDQIYVFEDGATVYKIQFLSYYNEDDESRHVTLLVGWLSGDAIPALSDLNHVREAPCIILSQHLYWGPEHTIQIRENNIDVCNAQCRMGVTVLYQNTQISGVPFIEVK